MPESASIPFPLEYPRDVLERLKSESFAETTVSVPPPPVIIPEPLQPLTSNELLPVPPVRLAVSIEVSESVPIPGPESAESVNVKFEFLDLTTVSFPVGLPLRAPEPVQPLTLNVCPPTPVFVNRAVPNPENEIAPRPAASV